ncbi:MAG TPA: hypothetical protein VNC61_17835 [Acidimicrobiales bacterium]|nr:hypothetical protein [Acidimicrobiales bacterium]
MAPPEQQSKRPMTAEHKEALARGRDEGRAVRLYLEAIEEQRPRPGRKRTTESINRRLGVVNDKLSGADALTRLHLLQEKSDLEAELARADGGDDMADLEARFLKVAKSYGERKAIGYSAWRAAGVDAGVLERAGIGRGKAAKA